MSMMVPRNRSSVRGGVAPLPLGGFDGFEDDPHPPKPAIMTRSKPNVTARMWSGVMERHGKTFIGLDRKKPVVGIGTIVRFLWPVKDAEKS